MTVAMLPVLNPEVIAGKYNREHEERLLEELKIFDYFKLQNCAEEKVITRAEFADALSRMNGERYYRFSDVSEYYLDVTSRHFAVNAINFVTTNGYMRGYGDGCFYPEREISVAEAVKSIVVNLGYDENAKIYGGYPSGYCAVASELGILDNISAAYEDKVTYENLKKMIGNALFCKMQLIDVENGEPIILKSEENVMNRFFGLYEAEGVVTATKMTALSDVERVKEKEIRIGQTVFTTEEDYSDLIGMKVTGYYTVNKDEKTLLYLYEDEKNNVIKIYGNDIYSFRNDRILYEDNTQDEMIRLDNSFDILKNNILFKDSYVQENLFPKHSFITFIDNDNDGYSEIIMIEEGDVGIINRVDAENFSIFDEESNFIKLDEYDRYELFDENGKKIDLTDVESGDVYTAYKTGNQYIKIIVSSKKVSGKIEGIYDDEIKINGETLRVNLKTYKKESYSLGANVNLMLDHNGLIVDCKRKSMDYSYGYIRKIWNDEENDENTVIKILKEDGKFENFTVSKLTADNVRLNGFSELSAYLEKLDYKVVRYKVNNDNILTEIDTLKEDSKENSIKVIRDCYEDPKNVKSYNYVIYHRSFMGKLTLSNNVKIFIVPENELTAGDEEFYVKDIAYMQNERAYSFVGMNSSDNEAEAEALLLFGNTFEAIKYNTQITLVSDMEISINEEDEVIYKISGYTEGNAVEVYSTSAEMIEKVHYADDEKKTAKVSKGDIIRLTKNTEGEIQDIDMLFDASDRSERFIDGFKNSSAQFGGYYSNVLVVCGKVYSLYSDIIQIADGGYNMANGYDSERITNFLVGSFKIFVVDNNEVRPGNKNDIFDYVHNREFSSNCIASTRWGQAKMLVIYK